MMLFLCVCFHLVEIEDDVKDYRKDHEKGAFNIYAAFVRRYGSAAPDRPARSGSRSGEILPRKARGPHGRAAQIPRRAQRGAGRRGAGDGPRGLQWGWALPTPIDPPIDPPDDVSVEVLLSW